MRSKLQDGQIVLFQGDSITDWGRDRSDITSLGEGYPNIVARLYQVLFPQNNVTFINKGIGGNRVRDLLGRYNDDFLSLKPNYISILIGVNDTWRRYDNNDPTSSEEFERIYKDLLSKIKEDLPTCKLIMVEPFLIHSVPGISNWREDLDPKIHIVRKLANEYADYYIPMDGIFAKAEAEEYKGNELAQDGVHPSGIGHRMIAEEFMKIFIR